MNGNIQYLRTDRAISSAFLHLLEKKPFEKITVQDILDATPVSRATFYKHHRDKYEIAEKLQAELLQTYRDLFDAFSQSAPDSFSLLVQQHGLRHQDMAQILMQVRTEGVDLSRALNDEAQARYLSGSNSETRELEARVYGAAVSAFFTGLLENKYRVEPEALGTVMLSVALRLLDMSDDPDVKKAVEQKYSRKAIAALCQLTE